MNYLQVLPEIYLDLVLGMTVRMLNVVNLKTVFKILDFTKKKLLPGNRL